MLLPFAKPCEEARFVSRHKRFTVLVERGGERFAAHTNNTGSMLGLLRPGGRIWLSESANPARKLRHTLEITDFHGTLVGVNTSTPLRLLRRAVEAGRLEGVAGCEGFRAEVARGNSRLDALLEGPRGRLWVECKNVTLVEDGGVAMFPDAVTERGLKHLRELAAAVEDGDRAALFFCVQHGDGRCFGPAWSVDEEYSRTLYEVVDKGVEVWAYRALVSPRGIDLGERLPLVLP
ncbi:DNA/RNA nuclease SfsA [Desulfovibrio aminophilus]|uniref:DNA/RNA nuclease SfsA n=1 Tax=Desulfovibrio aminophilus TaxID=81425 RepID=UPI0004007A28|nr:DNA/RNA nuclease SfsA [Desulfovibrio aminophilus]